MGYIISNKFSVASKVHTVHAVRNITAALPMTLRPFKIENWSVKARQSVVSHKYADVKFKSVNTHQAAICKDIFTATEC